MDPNNRSRGRSGLVPAQSNHRIHGAGGSVPKAAGFGTSDQRVRSVAPRRAATGPALDTFELNANESARLLHIIDAVSQITRHHELFLLLQGEVQHFIPHQIMLSAWGNFRDSSLNLDVISALQGVRTGQLNGCSIDALLAKLFARWVANGRQPMLIDNADREQITYPNCDCALIREMRGMGSLLVHGIYNERDEIHSLYLALNRGSIIKSQSAGRFIFLANAVFAQVDVAFRKMAALKSAGTNGDANASPRFGSLTAREQEIIKLVSEGKTNDDIARNLGISSYTVKNHVHQIFRKLDATNRTQAVAKCRREGLPAQK